MLKSLQQKKIQVPTVSYYCLECKFLSLEKLYINNTSRLAVNIPYYILYAFRQAMIRATVHVLVVSLSVFMLIFFCSDLFTGG